jgi:putative membrane protein PagO
MGMSAKIIVFSLLCIIWSSTWLMIKVGLEGAPPMLGAGLRFIIASLTIFAILRMKRIALPRTRRFYLLSLFLGIAQMGIPYALVYWGEQYISSGLTAILFSIMPIGVAILARLLLNNPLTIRKIAGIFAGMIGVAVIFSDSLRYEGSQSALGILAIVASAFMASLSSVIVKKYARDHHPLASIFLPITIAAVLLTATGLTLERSRDLVLDPLTLFTIIYLAVIGTVGAFWLYFWIIKHIDVTLLSYQTFIIPILACLLGWIILGETISYKIALGGLLIFIGIGLSMIAKKKPIEVIQ